MKKTWSLIRALLTQKRSTTTVKSILANGVVLRDNWQIAERFNEYFSSVADSLDNNIPYSDTSPLSYITHNMQCSFFCRPTDENEIVNIIQALKNTATNINELPVRILKAVRNIIAIPLMNLINKSIREGIFPDVLKFAKVVPIFKGGDVQSVCNYRPIAILPTISKIFEKCMSGRILNFLLKFNLISEKQCGFLKGKSTEDAFLNLIEYVYNSLNSKHHCISLFIDLKKAFDTVNHDILLRKLQLYGVRGSTLSWKRSYLSNRKQCVCISGSFSSERVLNVGVPQGSILGPILFLLYINDLTKVSPLFNPILYADDTTLLASSTDYDELIIAINNELPKFYIWTLANRLSLNLDKTFAMLFSNCTHDVNNDLSLFFNDNRIKFKTSGDFLGLIVDEEAKFADHAGFVCSKVSKAVGIMYKLREYVSSDVMVNLYYSLAYPYIIYGNLVWGGTYDVHLHPLIVMQKS